MVEENAKKAEENAKKAEEKAKKAEEKAKKAEEKAKKAKKAEENAKKAKKAKKSKNAKKAKTIKAEAYALRRKVNNGLTIINNTGKAHELNKKDKDNGLYRKTPDQMKEITVEQIIKLHLYILAFKDTVETMILIKNKIDDSKSFNTQEKGVAIRILKNIIAGIGSYSRIKDLRKLIDTDDAINNNNKFLINLNNLLLEQNLKPLNFKLASRPKDLSKWINICMGTGIQNEKIKEYKEKALDKLTEIKNCYSLFNAIKHIALLLYDYYRPIEGYYFNRGGSPGDNSNTSRDSNIQSNVNTSDPITTAITDTLKLLTKSDIIHGISFDLRHWRSVKAVHLTKELIKTGKNPTNNNHRSTLEEADKEFQKWLSGKLRSLQPSIMPMIMQTQIKRFIELYNSKILEKGKGIWFSYTERHNVVKAAKAAQNAVTTSTLTGGRILSQKKKSKIYTGSRGGKYMLKGGKKVYL